MGTSLVVQWLRIHHAMQETWFHPWLENEDPTCHRATKPMHHNYWAHRPQLGSLCTAKIWYREDPAHHKTQHSQRFKIRYHYCCCCYLTYALAFEHLLYARDDQPKDKLQCSRDWWAWLPTKKSGGSQRPSQLRTASLIWGISRELSYCPI